jgi:DNA-binding response OmpR family regulator
VSRALTANGLTVDTATDASRGLELARTGDYDLRLVAVAVVLHVVDSRHD